MIGVGASVVSCSAGLLLQSNEATTLAAGLMTAGFLGFFGSFYLAAAPAQLHTLRITDDAVWVSCDAAFTASLPQLRSSLTTAPGATAINE